MSDKIIDEIWTQAQRELEDHHYVGLWELVRSARRQLPEADDPQVKEAVLAMIGQGLRREEAEAGLGAVPGGLESVWNEPVDQIIDRIHHEWNELGRDPIPGEIVWFQKPGLDHAAEAEVIASPTQRYTQADGAQVFVRRVGDRYNVVIQGERGRNRTWKTMSERFLSRLAHERGWSPN